MKKMFSEVLHTEELSLKELGRWLLLAGLTGVLCGAVGAAFSHAIAAVTRLRGQYPWLLFCMPAAGVLIAWSYHIGGMDNDSGTNQIIAAVRSEQQPRPRLALLIFLGTVLTHLTGGSSGREGAALQIGGALSVALGRLFRLKDLQMSILVQCGMSGLFAALFGTPLTAAVFSLEVVSVGVFHYAALFPTLFSALTAAGTARLLGASGEAYLLLGLPAGGDPAQSALALGRTLILAVLAALLSILFCILMHQAAHLYKHYLPNPYLRAAVGGCLVVALTLLEGSGDYNGAGGALIEAALEGEVHVPWAFALKMLFTALTLGAGFRGGEIVPIFFTGATFGCAIGPLLGLDPAFAAAISMVALFCGAVNCPIASIFLAIELFGGQGLPFFAMACAVSFLLSGKFSLYASQQIVFSKLEPREINELAQ